MEQRGSTINSITFCLSKSACAFYRFLFFFTLFFLASCESGIINTTLEKSASAFRNISSVAQHGELENAAYIDGDYRLPDASIEADGEYAVIPTFFATNRSFSPAALPESMFGEGRPGEITFGKSYVILQRTGDTFDTEPPSLIKVAFNNQPTEPSTLANNEVFSREKFSDKLNRKIEETNDGRALIFVHGFNVSFEDAALRTAQLSYDLGFSATPFFLSWPARGDAPSYIADAETAQASQRQFEAMIHHVLSSSSADRIYLIAHGMGARLLARVMKNVFIAKPEFRNRIVEIILVAADISEDEFTNELAPYLGTAELPITLYATGNDPSFTLSKSFSSHALVGDRSNLVLVTNKVETIDAGNSDTSLARHSGFKDTNSIVADLWDLIQNGSRANSRHLLTARHTLEGTYWQYPR